MRRFKIGIIGAGAIVETNHLPALGVLPQAELGWIYDKNPGRAGLVSKMYGIPALGGGSVEDGLSQVDVCLVATPYGVRKPYITACKTAGKALVVEKPFAFSRQEHLDYCQGFQDWQIGVNLQRRFYRSVATLRNIVQLQLFGKLREVRFAQGNFSLKGGSGYLSDTALSGGGVIAESAIHSLDIILWITGALEVSVTSMRSLHTGLLDYDSVFDSEIVSPSGPIPVHCEISTLRNLDNGIECRFEHAVVLCDLSPEGRIFVRAKDSGGLDFLIAAEAPPAEGPLGAKKINEAFLMFWRQFLSGLDNNTPNLTSASGSLLTSAWIEGIYKNMNRV